MNKKVITITFQNAYNYGAILQCYALQKKIKKLGYDTEVLNYNNNLIGAGYKAIFINKRNPVKSIISSLMKFKPRYGRQVAFERFINNKINLSKKYSKRQIEKINFDNDILMVGSDQVWNPKITRGFDDIYTLNFAPDSKKISYAASTGNTQNIYEHESEYARIINRLEYVSVREDDACESLNNICSKKIERVIDPTLLISSEEWKEELEDVKTNTSRYIVAYVVEPDEEYIRIVNSLSEKTGLPIVHFGINNPGYKHVLKTAYTEGPLEFINYIKNAEYIVATSFHATVFSIIFNKKFFIVPHRKTGSRVTNLLDLLEIEGRIFYNAEEFENIDYDFETDWDEVNNKLAIEREKSVNWLKNAIER